MRVRLAHFLRNTDSGGTKWKGSRSGRAAARWSQPEDPGVRGRVDPVPLCGKGPEAEALYAAVRALEPVCRRRHGRDRQVSVEPLRLAGLSGRLGGRRALGRAQSPHSTATISISENSDTGWVPGAHRLRATSGAAEVGAARRQAAGIGRSGSGGRGGPRRAGGATDQPGPAPRIGSEAWDQRAVRTSARRKWRRSRRAAMPAWRRSGVAVGRRCRRCGDATAATLPAWRAMPAQRAGGDPAGGDATAAALPATHRRLVYRSPEPEPRPGRRPGPQTRTQTRIRRRPDRWPGRLSDRGKVRRQARKEARSWCPDRRAGADRAEP